MGLAAWHPRAKLINSFDLRGSQERGSLSSKHQGPELHCCVEGPQRSPQTLFQGT